MIPATILLCLVGFFVASNYRQLYSWWAVRQETKRLADQALIASFSSHKTIQLDDDFRESLSEDVWKLVLINGAGKASNGTSWHATALNVHGGGASRIREWQRSSRREHCRSNRRSSPSMGGSQLLDSADRRPGRCIDGPGRSDG